MKDLHYWMCLWWSDK